MGAHFLGLPIEELLSGSSAGVALSLGIAFAAIGLVVGRGLRSAHAAGTQLRAWATRLVGIQDPRHSPP